MSEYQLIELVFLAALAGYLIYRLYSVLGQSGPNDKSSNNNKDNVVPLRRSTEAIKKEIKVETTVSTTNPLLSSVMTADPHFDEEHFFSGAEYAFKMIVENFAKGNLSEIKQYLSKRVYDRFKIVTDKRASKNETCSTEVIAIESLEIKSSNVSRGIMKITLEITSDQATSIKDKDGNDLYPDDDEISRAQDTWTFRRKIGDTSPNWVLDEIHNSPSEQANGKDN